MATTPLDTRYRLFDAVELAALRVSLLTQIKAIEGLGQSHSLNGRSTSQATLDTLFDKLANVKAAQAWQRDNGDDLGCTSRYADFSRS